MEELDSESVVVVQGVALYCVVLPTSTPVLKRASAGLKREGMCWFITPRFVKSMG